jgi:hypothetical protein
MSDEFGEIVDSIYKTYFTKFWGQDDFKELKQKRLTFQQNRFAASHIYMPARSPGVERRIHLRKSEEQGKY